MRETSGFTRILESRQELFPDFSEEFPYTATLARIDRFAGGIVPWHWHEAVEMFYMMSGSLTYETPNQKMVFPAGSGGFVNAGVLHTTSSPGTGDETVQVLHIFEPSFVAGPKNSVISKQYVEPLISRTDVEIVPFRPDIPEEAELLRDLQASFSLDDQSFGYELHLRSALSDLWLKLLPLVPGTIQPGFHQHNEKIRQVMKYVQNHYAEHISVADLAGVIFVSERECYRLFHDCLHCSPLEYITSYRLDAASRLLTHSDASITEISYACGFSSNSYFGRIFLSRFGCTPSEYRRQWQDRERK